MDGPGRPTLYNQEYAEQAYKLCLSGATNEDLAESFEVSCSTIDKWLKAQPEFADAVRRGRRIADGEVAHRLYHRALGYTYETSKVVLNRGEPVSLPQTVHLPPDIRACIFWLRNRRPDKWAERARPDRGSSLTFEELEEASERARRFSDAA